MDEYSKNLNRKLNQILKNQKKILENESIILGEEEKLEEINKKEIQKEEIEIKDEQEALKELSELENKLKKTVSKPLRKITQKDLIKGFIGSFFGIIAHFSFAKGVLIAKNLNFLSSTVLFITGFIIINIMLYYSGFRTVKRQLMFKFMPIRASIIFLVSIFTIILVLFLFNEIHFPIHPIELYNLIAANIILAIIGAGTADLIGKNE